MGGLGLAGVLVELPGTSACDSRVELWRLVETSLGQLAGLQQVDTASPLIIVNNLGDRGVVLDHDETPRKRHVLHPICGGRGCVLRIGIRPLTLRCRALSSLRV